MPNRMSLIMSQSLDVSTVSTLVMAAPHALKGFRLQRPAPLGGSLLPALLPRPEIHLEGPGAALLAVELPIGLGDVVGIEDRIGPGVVTFREVGLYPFSVDGAVDHHVSHVDV